MSRLPHGTKMTEQTSDVERTEHQVAIGISELRRVVIKRHVRLASGGVEISNGGSCAICMAEWADDEPEHHALTCPVAAPPLASPQGVNTDAGKTGWRGPKWQHIKRGSIVTEIARGFAQVSHHPIEEMTAVVIYRHDADGHWWVRNAVEFDDGRFVPAKGLIADQREKGQAP